MKTLIHNKGELRVIFRERLSRIHPRERQNYSVRINEKLIELPEFKKAASVMTYLSLSREAETFGFARVVLKEKKTLIVPKVCKTRRSLLACRIQSLDQGFIANRYGIMEPDEEHTDPEDCLDIPFHVIPALAFAQNGYRLGRGGGYYDRFLAPLSQKAFFAGICFDCQLVDVLPTNPWDIPVHCIVTESRVLRIS